MYPPRRIWILSLLVLCVVVYSTRSCAQISDCYTIEAIAEGQSNHPSELDSLLSHQLLITERKLIIRDQAFDLSQETTTYMPDKDALLKRYQCIFQFPSVEQYDDSKATSYHLSGSTFGSNIHIIEVNSAPSQLYAYIRGYFFQIFECTVVPHCPDSSAMRTSFSYEQVKTTVGNDSSRYAYRPARFETRTERVLLKEASTQLEVTQSTFIKETEQVLIAEDNICPSHESIYDTVEIAVLTKDAHTMLTSHPAVFERVTEHVLVRDAATVFDTVSTAYVSVEDSVWILSPSHLYWRLKEVDTMCVSFDPFDCTTWSLDTLAADTLIIDYYDQVCPEGMTRYGQLCAQEREIPAEYESRSYERLVTPATTTIEEIPAMYDTYTRVRLANKADIPDSCVVQTYITHEQDRLMRPPYTEVEEIPAEYGDRNFQRLIAPASMEALIVDEPEVQTYTIGSITSEAGLVENRAILCDDLLRPYLLEELHRALVDRGYTTGSFTGEPNGALHDAITRYQYDRRLPIGRIDEELLDSLNIMY